MSERPAARRLSLPRANLWWLPTTCAALALVVFSIAQYFDRAHHTGHLTLPHWLDHGGAHDARELLSATAGAIITTLGLILSITVLTLSLASSQFGQRLLRRYMRDRGTQVSIGIFAATFLFSLLTLLSVTSRPQEREFVPWLSVWISTILAVSCIGVLIYFVHHVAQTIQVQNVIADIDRELGRVLAARPPVQSDAPAAELPLQPHLYVRAPASGYLRRIAIATLLQKAEELDVYIQLLRRPGEYILKDSRLAAVASKRTDVDRAELAAELDRLFKGAIRLGSVRSTQQDPGFLLAQLVEISLRAMSPGVNDPNTMFACLDGLSDGLRMIAQAPEPRRVHTDRLGQARVIECLTRFDDLVRATLDPLRMVARRSVDATERLLDSLALLAPHLRSDHTVELRRQADLLRTGISDPTLPADRERVEAAYQRALQAFADAAPPSQWRRAGP